MTDRELLELAAKAAGYGEVWYLEGHDTPYIGPRYEVGKAIQYTTFMPLTDDGDALRLAVALGLVVDCSRPSAGEPDKPYAIWLDETASNAELTRRAIVLAAAKIGRDKP